MKIEFCNHKREWDSFVMKNDGSILQSFGWGEFKKNYQKVWRMRALDDVGNTVGTCQVFEETLPFGKYLYIPHGPVSSKKEIRNELIKEIKRRLGKGFVFIKAEPTDEISEGRLSSHRIQPGKTSIVNINNTEEDLLMSFRKSTRYNIKAAKKKGVQVETDNNVDLFFDLLSKTKKRQGFESYSKEYFEKLLKETGSVLFTATYQKGVAVAIVSFFGETATFFHSASYFEKRKLNTTAFLVFESMKYAKKERCKKYDLWGVDERKYPGVTMFKRGFGGEEILYPPTKDFPLKRIQYVGYSIASKIKS